ncbi:MAG: hydrogenase maturation protease [Anaerolineaceae bacterium]|nr:hydrogenase maturation protease [Anaerolineaceae bacterium]
MKTLLLAYGNADRQDDGAAWHTLQRFAAQFGLAYPEFPGDETEAAGGSLVMLYLFQLLPEYAERIAVFERVLFMDAHNSSEMPAFTLKRVKPAEMRATFTHHMEASTLLEICKTLYGHAPQAWMMTIKGNSFQFSRQVSEETDKLVNMAVKKLSEFLGMQ